MAISIIEIIMKEIKITKEPVELYKLLKFESIVSSGGEAKHVISEGYVTLNGTLETRKRKKLVSDDVIMFNGKKYKFRLVWVFLVMQWLIRKPINIM